MLMCTNILGATITMVIIRVKLKKGKKKDKYLEIVRILKKKTVEHQSDGYILKLSCK